MVYQAGPDLPCHILSQVMVSISSKDHHTTLIHDFLSEWLSNKSWKDWMNHSDVFLLWYAQEEEEVR